MCCHGCFSDLPSSLLLDYTERTSTCLNINVGCIFTHLHEFLPNNSLAPLQSHYNKQK